MQAQLPTDALFKSKFERHMSVWLQSTFKVEVAQLVHVQFTSGMEHVQAAAT